MRIGIVCSTGSPIGLIPDDIGGKGVGGAELALMSTAEQWAKVGHEVSIYNNPRVPGDYQGVQYLPLGEWSRRTHDVLIVFRTPFFGARLFGGKKIFWSCDQYTEGDYRQDVFPFVDRVVTISPFHTDYFVEQYGLNREKIDTIGIGVRTWEYEQQVEKIPGRVIFCSVPDRGLPILKAVWGQITSEFPNLSLVITSDYRLWGCEGPMNEVHRRSWVGVPNVQFLGKVPRSDLITHQLQAQWMLYPCTYNELFCIALAECQVAGVMPITSGAGALRSTNTLGVALPGDAKTPGWQKLYTDTVTTIMRKQADVYDPDTIKSVASKVFGFEAVLAAWDEVLL